jgi:hypothetical protein
LRVAEVRKIDSSAIKVVRPELEIFYGGADGRAEGALLMLAIIAVKFAVLSRPHCYFAARTLRV